MVFKILDISLLKWRQVIHMRQKTSWAFNCSSSLSWENFQPQSMKEKLRHRHADSVLRRQLRFQGDQGSWNLQDRVLEMRGPNRLGTPEIWMCLKDSAEYWSPKAYKVTIQAQRTIHMKWLESIAPVFIQGQDWCLFLSPPVEKSQNHKSLIRLSTQKGCVSVVRDN